MTQDSIRTPELPTRFPAPEERYFARAYYLNEKNQEGADQYVHQHTNTLCVIGLAPSHAALKRRPVKVEYREGRNAKCTGKRKRGSFYVQEHTPVCDVVCEDGSRWTVLARLRGHLVEVNERLLSEPGLLCSHPETQGYVGIIAPKFADRKQAVAAGLDRAQYCAARGVEEAGRAAPKWCVMDEEAEGAGEDPAEAPAGDPAPGTPGPASEAGD
eukprot:tig00020563_g11385.t1